MHPCCSNRWRGSSTNSAVSLASVPKVRHGWRSISCAHPKQRFRCLLAVKQQVRQCVRCHYISDQEYCAVCRNPVRQTGAICVVEDPLDALAIERTGIFKGCYHVLHGRIAPLEGMGREDIFFDDLLERIGTESIREVIIATNPNLEGEATAAYLQRELSPLGTRVTRLARGLPTGGDLEWADTHTLTSALEGRRELF